jgi:hypothetical protein
MRAPFLRWITPFLGFAIAATAWAGDPRLQLYDGPDGATCKSFNAGGQITWRHRLGDWRDATGEAQGDTPFSTTTIEAGAGNRPVEWDLTPLVRGWIAGAYPNSGLLLATVSAAPSGRVAFFSREANAAHLRPRLTVQLAGVPQPKTFVPIAEASLNCSTAYALGMQGELHVGPGARTVIQFDLAPLEGRRIRRASLELTTSADLSSPAAIGIFRIDPPVSVIARGKHTGIAAAYRRDRGIDKDPDVVMATGFELPLWRSDWSYVSLTSHADRINRDERRRFVPFSGHALRVEISQDDNLGLDMGFDFKDRLGYEPEEIYFRYYLRFADDWNPTVDGGKLPGLAGTYGKAGWGGRRADPLTGWSMRGQFNRAPSPANPLHGRATVGTYAYHADMEDDYGDHWYWITGGRGVLERNRWYCLEQYFRVNTPGSKDGVLRAWVDGALAFEKTDVHVRDVTSLRLEKVWMNVYHGGTAKAARDLHLYIDNVVVAKKPIGCVAG